MWDVRKQLKLQKLPRAKQNLEGEDGKEKAKKSQKTLWPCGVCKNNCIEDSVACVDCDSWYHFTCIHIENENELWRKVILQQL